MDLRFKGEPTKLQPGDKLVYDGKRISIYRGRYKLRFAGGTDERFLVPQAWADGFLLASVISYVTGLPFEIDHSGRTDGYLFKAHGPGVIDAEFSVVTAPQIAETKRISDQRL